MNEMRIFDYHYHGNTVRTVERDGEPWFVLKDVCNVLGLGSAHKVADRLDEDERNQIPLTDSLGREQETTIINESGLYGKKNYGKGSRSGSETTNPCNAGEKWRMPSEIFSWRSTRNTPLSIIRLTFCFKATAPGFSPRWMEN